MKKDINFPEVRGVKIAIAKSSDEKGESDYYVYVINNKDTDLSKLMIVSNANEKEDGTGRKTSTLRHFMEGLNAGCFAKVERIDPAVFSFHNEFWLSFFIGNELYDHKFKISPFSEWELEDIQELELKGKLAI